MSEDSLEEKARKLLLYYITKEGKVPNLLTLEYQDALQSLLSNNYLTKSYVVTPEGIKFADIKNIEIKVKEQRQK